MSGKISIQLSKVIWVSIILTLFKCVYKRTHNSFRKNRLRMYIFLFSWYIKRMKEAKTTNWKRRTDETHRDSDCVEQIQWTGTVIGKLYGRYKESSIENTWDLIDQRNYIVNNVQRIWFACHFFSQSLSFSFALFWLQLNNQKYIQLY